MFWQGFWEWAKASPFLSFLLFWVFIAVSGSVLRKFFGMFEYKRKIKVERQEEVRTPESEKPTLWARLNDDD